jgi:adenine/guanine/hypoxanthine permease
MSKVNYPLFKKEDIDGFFALFQNNLANFVIIAVTLLRFGYPKEIVFGKVIPGAAIAVLAGNLYYSHMAKKLAMKENRSNVTALSYGISTPVMFLFLFSVLKPALDITGDPNLAWKIGVAATLLGGIIEALGSVIGRWVRKSLPRPAMLGALAGVAFALIGGQLFFQTFEMPVVGMMVLAIILIGLVAKQKLPFRIPASLFAIVIGTVLAYSLKQADAVKISDGLKDIGFYPILPTLAGFQGIKELLTTFSGMIAVLIPISVYNFIETMNNVEAMAAAGDDYDVAEAQLADGAGTILGALFGGCFPTTVYIASVGSKWMNAGRGYSILNGIVFLVAAMTGVIAALAAIIPVPVIAPILVFVGITMVSQAFISAKEKYTPAVVIAMFPYLANYVVGKFNKGPIDVDTSGAFLTNLTSPGLVPLSQGAMFTAIVWGAIMAYIIDRHYHKAAIMSLIGAVLSFVGIMHAPKLALGAATDFAIGYVVVTILFGIFFFAHKNNPQKDMGPEEQTLGID